MVLPWLVCLVLGSYLLSRASVRVVASAGSPAAKLVAEREFHMTLMRPAPNEHIAAHGDATKVQFHWRVTRSDDTPIPRGFPAALLLELSPSREFPPDATETTRLPSLVTSELSEYLAPGRYYWRLRIGTSIVTDTREFRVIRGESSDD